MSHSKIPLLPSIKCEISYFLRLSFLVKYGNNYSYCHENEESNARIGPGGYPGQVVSGRVPEMAIIGRGYSEREIAVTASDFTENRMICRGFLRCVRWQEPVLVAVGIFEIVEDTNDDHDDI